MRASSMISSVSVRAIVLTSCIATGAAPAAAGPTESAAAAPSAAGQAPASAVTLTFEQAIARGLEHAPRLAESRARLAAARAAVRARRALSLPTLTASSSVLRTNHVDEFGVPQPDGGFRVIFPDIPTNYRFRGELELPIFTSGRLDALVASADADSRAAVSDERATTADVRLQVSVAYWTLVSARDVVAVRQRGLDRADAALGDVVARVETGFLPPNDRLSAQAQRARQRVQVIQAQHDASLAEAELARLVGLPPGTPIVTATTVDRPTPDAAALIDAPPEALTARAIEARPEREALVARRAAFEASADAITAATRPQVGALAAVEPARPNSRFVPRTDTWNTSWDVGVNVRWSVWDGGRASAERAATIAQADALAARIEDFDAAVAVEVRQRLLDIETTRAALDASAEAVEAATEAQRVVGERFAAGVATSTDVLEAEVARLEAELERARLLASLRIAEARLLRTAGRP